MLNLLDELNLQKVINPKTTIKFYHVSITSATAEYILEHRKLPNRKLIKRKVESYTESMLDNKWELTHQGIAFDPDGYLIDGENRLVAIAKSGISQEIIVAHYQDTDHAIRARLATDSGSTRTKHGALTIKHGHSFPQRRSELIVALISYNSGMSKSPEVPTYRIEEFDEKYKESIDFVLKQFEIVGNKKGIAIAPVLAAFTRAYYYCDRTRLSEMISILGRRASSSVLNTDSAATKLLDFLDASKSKTGWEDRMGKFLRTENMIRHFCNRDVVRAINKVDKKTNLYPLPTK